MKKIIIALVAMAFAVVANAGTISWATGNLLVAAGVNGGWTTGSANGFAAQQQEVLFSVFYVDAEDYATYSTMKQSALYDAFKGETADFKASNYNGTTYANSAIAKDTAGVASQFYYAVVIAEYTDTNLKQDFYIANVGSGQANTSGTKAIGNLISAAGARTEDGGWQTASAVPEPTSGLLLILGVASLALRRKQR